MIHNFLKVKKLMLIGIRRNFQSLYKIYHLNQQKKKCLRYLNGGPCKMVKLVLVKATGRHRGSAFVHYYTEIGVKCLAAGAGRIIKDKKYYFDTDDINYRKNGRSRNVIVRDKVH